MGGTAWSDDHYTARARHYHATGTSAFVHDTDIRTGKAARGVHAKMNPKGVKLRESRDSDAHPTSHAVAVLFDVTGSMRNVPRTLQANLPKLMGLLIRKSYLEHPQILIGAIGDATCDDSPIQVGQFESGIEIEDDLGKLHLEGGGGGHITESYELALYWMARHTSIDCFEKRGKRGYLFVIGDEAPYPKVKRHEVERLIGDHLESDIPTSEIVRELEKTFEVYYIIPGSTNNWDDEAVLGAWRDLLGQRVIKLEDPAAICETIAATIGLAEGRTDIANIRDDLAEIGSTANAAAVSNALVPLAKGVGGAVASIPDSGPNSGLATI